MHLNGVCNQLSFVLNINLPKVKFLSLVTKYSDNIDANCTTSPLGLAMPDLFPGILIHFSPTQEYTWEHKIATNIGNTLLFEKLTIDHDKPLCCGYNGLDPATNYMWWPRPSHFSYLGFCFICKVEYEN